MLTRQYPEGEILVLTLHDISESPSSYGWYKQLFQDLVDSIISQGVPILTMDELYRLQSGNIRIPQPINGSCWDAVVLDEYALTVNSAHGVVTKVPDQATLYLWDGCPADDGCGGYQAGHSLAGAVAAVRARIPAR